MKVFIFDNETDGLQKNSAIRIDKRPHITELFGLTIDNDTFEELGIWQSLFKQAKPLPELIVKITGITDAMLENEPLFFTKAQELKAHIESHDIVVAHNLTFDMAMVDNEMERIGVKVNWPKTRLCTVEQTEHVKGFRLSLTGLHEHLFGAGFPDAHRAENDVRALARCYIELRKRGEL